MRVTSTHIVDVANEAAARAQSAVAQASEVATSGMRVAVPSDDPVAWATAQRDKIHQVISQGGGKAISTTLDQLQQTDGALSTIADVVSQARALAVQGILRHLQRRRTRVARRPGRRVVPNRAERGEPTGFGRLVSAGR